MRDWQQNENVLEEVHSWVLNKRIPEPRRMKNGASKELWEYWVQYTNLCLREGLSYRTHQTEPSFEIVYQMLVPWERVFSVFELLLYYPTAGHFVTKKT